MGYFGDSVRALTTTIKNVFRKPVTVHYPAQKRERAERYRNTFALLHDSEGDELCVGCLQCERICPSQVITVIAEKKESPVTSKRRGYAKDFTLDLNACIFCELCVQVCPTDAIIMTRQPEEPSFTREGLCLTMDKLYANETGKPPTWATASKLMEMQDPKRGQPKPEKKAKAPAAKPTPEKAPAAKPSTQPAPTPKSAAAAEPAPDAKAAAQPAADLAPAAAKPAAETAAAKPAATTAASKAPPAEATAPQAPKPAADTRTPAAAANAPVAAATSAADAPAPRRPRSEKKTLADIPIRKREEAAAAAAATADSPAAAPAPPALDTTTAQTPATKKASIRPKPPRSALPQTLPGTPDALKASTPPPGPVDDKNDDE